MFPREKSFGAFQCPICMGTWTSAHAFKIYTQGCKKCDVEGLPLFMWLNEQSGSNEREFNDKESETPHDSERCEACRRGKCIRQSPFKGTPSQLIGGYRAGETIYFKGADCTLSNGFRLLCGMEGKVVKADVAFRLSTEGSLAVQFSKLPGCMVRFPDLDRLSRTRPPPVRATSAAFEEEDHTTEYRYDSDEDLWFPVENQTAYESLSAYRQLQKAADRQTDSQMKANTHVQRPLQANDESCVIL